MKNQKSKIKNQKLNSKVFKFLLLILPFAFYFLPSKTFAQQISIGVYPPIIQIQAKPPASVSNPITIENTQDQPLTLDIAYRQFKPSSKANGDIEFIDGDLPSVFDKMQVLDKNHVINQVTLAPKQKKTLTFHVGLTPDEKPQDYYFSILFISNGSTVVSSSRSLAAAGIATNILLSVGPTGPTKGGIEEFSTPGFVSKGPVPFKIKVKNESSHYITPNGIVTIKNMFGQTVGKIDLLPVNVLSKSSRYIPDLQGSLEKPTASWNEKFLLGPYTAKVTIGLSDQGPIYGKTTTFFAFPIELIAGVLISICVVFVIFKKVRERQIGKTKINS